MPCFNASLVLAGRVAFVAAMTDITAPSARPTSSWSIATFRGTKVYAGGTR
jgi:hypothetical protein